MNRPPEIQKTDTGIIAWFTNNPVAANLLMLSILILGGISASGLRIEGFPSFEPNTIGISVTYPSGNARQTEESVTIKIEQALKGVAGIKEIRATSTIDASHIIIERTSGYDLNTLNDDIKNRVNSIFNLPANAEKPIIRKRRWRDHALWINLYGEIDQHSLQTLSQQFETALLDLPSIQKVEKHGWKTPEISIEVNESSLQAFNLTLKEVSQRIKQESLNVTSGELRSENGLILLKADKQANHYQDFANIVIRSTTTGGTIFLRDIAKIRDTFEESPNVLSRFQGKPAINLRVIIDETADILSIAEDTQELVNSWQSSNRLPDSIDITIWWNQSYYMLDRLMLLIKNGAFGILLVMLVLAVFLDLRIAFWVGMGLPVCFSGALLLMGESFLNLTLNDLTTFGFIIVLGMLVDDAVVVGESIYSSRERNGDNTHATIRGVKNIATPTIFGVLTTVAAFYPLSFISGEMGNIFGQFALVAVACLLFSLIESKLILPAHLNHLNTHKTPSKNRVARRFQTIQESANGLLYSINQRIYKPVIKRAICYRYATLLLFITLFVLVLGMIPSGKVGFIFFPDVPRDIIEIDYSTEEGSGYGMSHQQAQTVEEKIVALNTKWQEQHPDQPPVIQHRQIIIDDDRNTQLVLELSPESQRSIPANTVISTLRQSLSTIEGMQELNFIAGWSSLDNFSLKLMANNHQQLETATEKVISKLRTMQGVNDIRNDLSAGQPQLHFELTAEGRALGLTSSALALQIQQEFYGEEVQRIQRDNDEIKVKVRYEASDRRDITSLQTASVRTPNGDIVPLSAVAQVSSGYTVNKINRINGKVSTTIRANIDKKVTSLSLVTAALEQSIISDLRINQPDLNILHAGEAAEEAEATESMIMMFGLSLSLIYILVAIPLKSYWQPIVIMSAIPFGIVGAIIGHWIMDLPISMLSLNGILALSGLVINDSLLLVSRFNSLTRSGLDLSTALVSAGSDRMRAIVLTSTTTFVGLSSLLQETSGQAQYLIPAATSLAYGILFATLITLVLIPVLLHISDDIRNLFIAKEKNQSQPSHIEAVAQQETKIMNQIESDIHA